MTNDQGNRSTDADAMLADELKADAEKLRHTWHAELFGVRRSVRYHMRRRRFFGGLRRIVAGVTVIFGSATVLGLLKATPLGPNFPLWTAAIVTIISALDLVIGFSQSESLHSDLYRRFLRLESEMTTTERSKEQLNHFRKERCAIELEEPPALRNLNRICHNEVALSLGYDGDDIKKVGFWQARFAHFFDLGQYKNNDRSSRTGSSSSSTGTAPG